MPERSRWRRLAIIVAGWLGAAVLVTGLTLAVVSSIGAGIFGSSAEPLTRDELAQELSALPESSRRPKPEPSVSASPSPSGPTPSASASPADSPTVGQPTVITSAGGTVVARCSGGLVELVSWSPAQGFRVEDADRGPDRSVDVEFESSDRDVEVEIHCVGGVPDKVANADD